MENNVDNQKAINTQNIAVMKQNAIDSFASLVTEARASIRDQRSVNFSDKDKSRVLIYYGFFKKENKDLRYSIIYITLALVFFIVNGFFNISIVKNQLLNDVIVGLSLFLIPSFLYHAFKVENNIENFFTRLYNFGNIEEKGRVANLIKDFIFTKQQNREIGYNGIIYSIPFLVGFFILVYFSNLTNVGSKIIVGSFICFLIYCISIAKNNIVFKFIAKAKK